MRNKDDSNSCEICFSSYSIERVAVFDKKACRLDVLKVFYAIFAILLFIFAVPFAMFGQTLFDWPINTVTGRPYDGQIIGIFLGTVFMYTFIILPMFCSLHVCDMSIKVPFFANNTKFLQFITVIYYAAFSIIIIQGLSLFIVNPILGRPIAFTPRGETFGIMLGISIGVLLVALIIYKIIIETKNYAVKHWITEKEIYVNKNNDNLESA